MREQTVGICQSKTVATSPQKEQRTQNTKRNQFETYIDKYIRILFKNWTIRRKKRKHLKVFQTVQVFKNAHYYIKTLLLLNASFWLSLQGYSIVRMLHAWLDQCRHFRSTAHGFSRRLPQASLQKFNSCLSTNLPIC